MANSDHAINHCGSTFAVREAGLTAADVTEAVMTRSGEMVRDAQTGEVSEAHEFGAIELMARTVANHVIERGAARCAADLGVDLEQLKGLAASEHISSC